MSFASFSSGKEPGGCSFYKLMLVSSPVPREAPPPARRPRRRRPGLTSHVVGSIWPPRPSTDKPPHPWHSASMPLPEPFPSLKQARSRPGFSRPCPPVPKSSSTQPPSACWCPGRLPLPASTRHSRRPPRGLPSLRPAARGRGDRRHQRPFTEGQFMPYCRLGQPPSRTAFISTWTGLHAK